MAANEPAAAPRNRLQPSATRVDRNGPRHSAVKGLILQPLGTLGEWVANQDLAELVFADAGYESPRAMAGMLAASLDGLRSEGVIEAREERDGRTLRRFHQAIAGCSGAALVRRKGSGP